MKFTYLTQPPKRYTFEMPKLKEWTEQRCTGLVLNLFAGMTKLDVREIRVDIDPETKPDFLMDAYDFVKNTDMKFDTVIYDPPYNLRKAREKYKGRYIGLSTKIKEILPRIMNIGGIIISYGYDSVGMAAKRGFEKQEICLICHGGDHNDTIVLLEKFTQVDLFREADVS